LCTSAGGEPLVVATTYVYAAAYGVPSLAVDCVYHDAVPASVTARLQGKSFTPDFSSATGSGPFRYRADDGTTVVVTVTKEPDGRYYVTNVTVS
jgi:hypothetical protein